MTDSLYRRCCNKLFGKEVETFGLSSIVRLYCGYPSWLPMPFNVYHGWYIEVPRPADLRHRSSLLLVYNKRHAEEWRACTDKPVAIFGAPFIHYRRLKNIQRRADAAGTIVYPGHDATLNDFVFDIRKFCAQLAALPEKFHPVTVSVLEEDIRAGKDKVYRDHGFRTCFPGTRRDRGFCRAFYEELARHRYACGNHFGTNILYVVEMGVPFFFLGEIGHGVDRARGEMIIKNCTPKHDRLRDRVLELFAEPVDEVTPEQRALILAESGIEDCLPPDEVRRLLLKMFLTRELPRAVFTAVAWPFKRLRRASAQVGV